MESTSNRRRFLRNAILTIPMVTGGGCGSILHPERVGQPRGGPIDWKIAALDGIGLMLFVVPGVIAFAVDFYNGTIFLPHSHYSQLTPNREDELLAVNLEAAQLSQREVERVVSDHVNQRVQLAPGSYASAPLESVGDFWSVASSIKAS